MLPCSLLCSQWRVSGAAAVLGPRAYIPAPMGVRTSRFNTSWVKRLWSNLQAADRGNFASRLSHSCGPNCRNVAVVVGSRRITNALFTSRPVAAGEELSWDYACVTESEREFRAAICLCGSHACRGSFLYYANSTTFQQVITNTRNRLQAVGTSTTRENLRAVGRCFVSM